MTPPRQQIDLYSRFMVAARRLSRHYVWILLVATLITAACIQITSRLRFNSDLADLLPPDHPDLRVLRRIQAKYSTDTGFMVLLSKYFVYAVDDTGAVHLHDGRGWSRPYQGPPLYALWGLSPTRVFAAGESGTIVAFDGARWTPQASGTRQHLRGLWGDAGRIIAVGDAGTILGHDGRRWVPLASPTRANLRAISGHGQVAYLVGDGGTILRLDGTTLSPESAPTSADLLAVWAAGSETAFAAGKDGTLLRRGKDGWRPLRAPTRQTLRGIWGTDASAVWIVGDRGTMLRYDGRELRPSAADTTADLRAVHGTRSEDIWIAGTDCALEQHTGGKWRRGPGDPPRRERPWYAVFRREKPPTCATRYTAVWRPAVSLDRAKAFAPRLAAQLQQSPNVSRVEYRKPVRFFLDRALYYMSPPDLETLRDKLEESLERETAKGTGLYVDLEEEGSKRGRQELRDLLGKYRKQASRYGTDEWYSHPDQTAFGLVVFPAKGLSDFENLRRLKQEIEAIVARSGYRAVDPLLQVDVGGDGVHKINEYDATLYDIFGTLWIPVVGVVLIIIIYFRRLVGLFLSMIPLGMSICWTAAVTTLIIGTLNYVTGFLFAVLLGLGIDYGIQLFGRYREGRSAGLSPEESMDHVILDTGRATLTSALTTSVALLTMTIADFRGFSEFGLIAGVGILLALLSFILVLPAMIFLAERLHLLRLPVRRTKASTAELAPGQEPFRAPRLILAASILITLYGLFGATRLSFEYDTRKLRPSGQVDEVERRSYAAYGQSFNPTLLLAPSQEALAAAMSAIRRRSEALGPRTTVESVVSILDLVPPRQHEKQTILQELEVLLHDKRWNLVSEATRQKIHLADLRTMARARPFGLTELPVEVRRGLKGPGQGDLWLAMVFQSVDVGDTREAKRLKAEVGRFAGTPWVNLGNLLPAGARALVEADRVEIRCPPSDERSPQRNARCVPAVRRALTTLRHEGRPVFTRVLDRQAAYREKLAVPGGLQGDLLALTRPGLLPRSGRGDAAIQPSGIFHVSSGEVILAEVVEVLLHDGRISFLLAFLAVFVTILIDFRSLRLTLLAILPLALGFLWTFGLMNLIGLKLNLFNFVILPAMMGIGIDYGVHYVHRYREEGPGNLGRVMRSLYWVIFFCAITTVVGFGNVSLATHPGLKSLGNLAIIGIACVFFASTYSLPAVLYAIERLRGIRPAVPPVPAAEVVVYTTSYCPSCRLVRRFLAERGVPHHCVEVDTLPQRDRQALAAELVRTTGADALPITRLGEGHVVGFDPVALGALLDRTTDQGTQ